MASKKTPAPTSSIAAVILAAGATRADFERALAAGAIDADLIQVTAGGHRKVLNAPHVIGVLQAYLALANDEEDPPLYDLVAEKAKREHFSALREELRYLTEAGELVARDEYEREVTTLGTVVKDRLTQIPAQHAARLAGITDPTAMELDLERVVATLLAEIRQETEQRLRA